MRIEEAGFIDDARKFFDDGFAVDFFGIGDKNEGEVGTAEEFLEIFGVGWAIIVEVILDFDGANGAKGALVAENKIDGTLIDEAVGEIAILAADFVVEEGGEADARDNVEFFAKNVVEKLETMFFGADHELFFGVKVEAVGEGLTTASGDDIGNDGDDQKAN